MFEIFSLIAFGAAILLNVIVTFRIQTLKSKSIEYHAELHNHYAQLQHSLVDDFNGLRTTLVNKEITKRLAPTIYLHAGAIYYLTKKVRILVEHLGLEYVAEADKKEPAHFVFVGKETHERYKEKP